MPHLEAHWWWLAIAAALAVAEIIAPGIFMIWLAAAAALTGLAVWLIPGMGPPVGLQLVIFAVLAFGSVYVGRFIMRRNPGTSTDPLLNNRAARLVGEIGTVMDPIANGSGRVQVADSPWPAVGPDAPLGAKVRIVGVEGTRLRVEPLAAREPQAN